MIQKFILIFSLAIVSGQSLNNNKIKKLKIPIGKTQVESIKIINKSSFWITSEAELFGKPKLYKISL